MKDIGNNPTVSELFAAMREEIENDLAALDKLYPDQISTCPSQKLRTIQALECISTDLKAKRPSGVYTYVWKHRRMLCRLRNRLEDFLAVHRTAMMLEDRTCGLFDHWMTDDEKERRARDQNQIV